MVKDFLQGRLKLGRLLHQLPHSVADGVMHLEGGAELGLHLHKGGTPLLAQTVGKAPLNRKVEHEPRRDSRGFASSANNPDAL